jgi:23S rRNA (adenine2503-C2)-methyltransferase
MGMGEPAHNTSITCWTQSTYSAPRRHRPAQSELSTVGDPRVFERLPQQQIKPALALSLHSTDAELRQHLLPRAPRNIDPEGWWRWAKRYARDRLPIEYQWTLLKASTTRRNGRHPAPAQGQCDYEP